VGGGKELSRLGLVLKTGNVKRKVIILTASVLVIVIGTALSLKFKAANGHVPANVREVVFDSIQVMITANGMIEEVNKKEIYIEDTVMPIDILVQEGDSVVEGQVLSVIDGGKYSIELQKARASLEKARLDLQKFRDFGLPETELAYKNATRSLEHAKKSLENMQLLFDNGGISESQLEAEKIKFDQANEAFRKAENAYKTSSAELKSYENQVVIYELALQEAEQNFKKFGPEIKSPIEGTVTNIGIKEGVLTNPSQPLFTISDLSSLRINVDISEYDISRVKVGQPVEITSDAIEGKVFSGIVKSISPVARVTQVGQSLESTVRVTIDITANGSALKPGYSAKAKIIADSKEDCLVIPFDAIITESNGAKVVYVVQNGIAYKKEIQTGIESDFTTEVTKGLNKGDLVIVAPPPGITEGMKVKAI
jgi:HlyD family secretion protein